MPLPIDRLLSLCFALCLVAAGASTAQDAPIPERRGAGIADTDFYGGDLRAIYDTGPEFCQSACLAEPACRAFTFNTRSNACFLKSADVTAVPFAGAISARVVDVPGPVVARARILAAALSDLPSRHLEAAQALARSIALDHPLRAPDADPEAEAAVREQRGDLIGAIAALLPALNREDSPQLWLRIARLARAADPDDYAQAEQAREQAVAAALNAYLRAPQPKLQAEALVVLAEALEDVGDGRAAIDVLRRSFALAPDPGTEAALDRMVGLYGFRVLEARADFEAQNPRICVVFSEPLRQAGVDYADFVRFEDAGHPVEAEKAQLCLGGLEHGATYRFALREGLPAASGERLDRTIEQSVYLRDRSPSVRFPGRNYVLPREAAASVPIVAVNTDEVAVEIARVDPRGLAAVMRNGMFGIQLQDYEQDELTSSLGEIVRTGHGEVATTLNQDVTTALPVGEAIDGLEPGLYAMTARVAEAADDHGTPATQWFVVTDLGLATIGGADGLHVFVRALSTALPAAGVTVDLIARDNAVLASAESDAAGHVRFDAGFLRGDGGAEPGFVVARQASDMVFLSLRDAAFDLSDRGVEGRPAPPPVDVFATTDRGAYRPGETVHATVLTRDAQAEAVTSLPLTAIIRRPDGVEHGRETLPDQGAGGRVLDLTLGADAQRGSWRIALHADPDAPPLDTLSFLVEDFVPERIDFTLSLPEGPLQPAAAPVLDVTARFLFGAPGADLRIEGETVLAMSRGVPGFEGFVFGLEDEPFQQAYERLPSGLATDAGGKAAIPLLFADLPPVSRPLEATVTLRLADGSGQPVERSLNRPVPPAGNLIGVRPLFEGAVEQAGTARFEVLALGPDLRRTALPDVAWTLTRIETTYQWYELDGSWNYEPMTRREKVANGTLDLASDTLARIETPVDWGRYELTLATQDGSYTATSLGFSAGWYAAGAGSDTPDVLDVTLDRARYATGDTARVRFDARDAGQVLIAVVSDRLIEMQALEVPEGETVVDLSVTDEWRPGVYVTATLVRPMDVAAGRNPARALGLGWAGIEPGSQRMAAEFLTPDEADPRQPLNVALQVADLPPGETVFATIAAVDLGILNLTGFDAPDPTGHYFGQRKLGVELRDLYGRLIDPMQGVAGRLRSGGDAGIAAQAPLPTEKLVAFFAGPLTVDENGVAEVVFDLPDFNGTVRLMAVVWSDTAVGQASTDVLVRDRVVAQVNLPRFLAPGDTAEVGVDLTHVSGPAGEMALELTTPDPDLLRIEGAEQAVMLAEQAGGTAAMTLTALEVGDAALRLDLTPPGGSVLTKDLVLPVRDLRPEIARQSRFKLGAGETLMLDAAVFDGLREGTARVTLAAGPLAAFDIPGLLTLLDGYPYGCTEQVASRALALIYFDQLAVDLALAERETLRERIDKAITAVLANQTGTGGFGLWGPYDEDAWLDAYITDFLARARGFGYAVPDRAFQAALLNLRNRVNAYDDFEDGGVDLAYALMVLAREGAAQIGDLRYYADTKANDFATPLAKAQLAVALASYGDQVRADRLFAAASSDGLTASDGDGYRADYGSALRDAAGVLALAVEAGSNAADVEALAARITELPTGTRSTQEAIWTALAAHALLAQAEAGVISVDGTPAGPALRLDEATLRRGEPVRITNEGVRETEVVLTAFGVPDGPQEAGGNGYQIARRYYTLEGDEVNLDAVARNTRLVAVLTVTPERDVQARLIVDDQLPAGFAIDNPDLLRAGDLASLSWLRTEAQPAHVEFRADSFRAAMDWSGPEQFQLAYALRATTPGDFRHPAASVADMYRPAYRATTDTSRATVTAP